MAQLKDSTIDGNLEITGDIILKTARKSIRAVHPETGEISTMVHMDNDGTTSVGYGGYLNANANSRIYGNDIEHYVASVNESYRPYYRAGDSVNILIRTAGYCVGNGANVRFSVPLGKPVIGNPVVTATSRAGLILLQDGKYTHDSGGDKYVYPVSYTTVLQNGNIEIWASMSTTTNSVTLDSIGIVWSGTLTFS